MCYNENKEKNSHCITIVIKGQKIIVAYVLHNGKNSGASK